MINWALVKKDIRLLGNYLRFAVVVTPAVYLVWGAAVVWFTSYTQEAEAPMRSTSARVFLTLSNASTGGMVITGFLAGLIAGSVLTLERIDRSAEFLACLPPTRGAHLRGKLCVLFGSTLAMLCIHILAACLSSILIPYVRTSGLLRMEPPTALGLVTAMTVILSVIGGALAVSAWMNSNGVPILCGLLTPTMVGALVLLISYMLGVETSGQQFQARFVTASLLIGVCLTISGSYWYLAREEP